MDETIEPPASEADGSPPEDTPIDPSRVTSIAPTTEVPPVTPTSEVPTVAAPMPSLMPLSMPAFGDPAVSGGPPPPPSDNWSQFADPIDGPPPRRSRKVFAAAIAVALLAGGLGAGLGATIGGSNGSGPGTGNAATTIPGPSSVVPAGSGGSVSRIAAAVTPGVVDINTNVASPVGSGPVRAAGTGMIITRDGEVLTNNHVVDMATSISVTINGRKGSFRADVLGVDDVHDVALIKIQGVSGLPIVNLGDSATTHVGDSVVAIGNALGLGGSPTVVPGIISAKNRSIQAADGGTSESLAGLLQTNAQIAPGDSGGPLVNSKGQVIGMDTAAASSDGTGTTIGFAIPINNARSIAQAIEKKKSGNGVTIGTSPFIGIQLVTAQPSFGGGFGFSFGDNAGQETTTNGVPVAVIAGSPAQSAGLVAGDVITAVNGQQLAQVSGETAQWQKLQEIVGVLKPGQRVSITYLDANNQSHTTGLTLAGLPH